MRALEHVGRADATGIAPLEPMTADEAERFLSVLAAVEPPTRALPIGFDSETDRVNALTDDVELCGFDLYEHADWLAAQSWTTLETVQQAYEAAERHHGAPRQEIASAHRWSRNDQRLRLARRRRVNTPTRVSRRRTAHRGRPGHRRPAASRAGPDDPEPAPHHLELIGNPS